MQRTVHHLPFGSETGHGGLVAGEDEAFVEGAVVLPLQLAQAPVGGDGFLFVEAALGLIFDAGEEKVVRPREVERETF